MELKKAATKDKTNDCKELYEQVDLRILEIESPDIVTASLRWWESELEIDPEIFD